MTNVAAIFSQQWATVLGIAGYLASQRLTQGQRHGGQGGAIEQGVASLNEQAHHAQCHDVDAVIRRAGEPGGRKYLDGIQALHRPYARIHTRDLQGLLYLGGHGRGGGTHRMVLPITNFCHRLKDCGVGLDHIRGLADGQMWSGIDLGGGGAAHCPILTPLAGRVASRPNNATMPGMETAASTHVDQFDGLAFAKVLPGSPGVYRYFDAKGELLYIGKARNLQKRVSSYFLRAPEDPRIASMVSRIARAEFTVVPTEVDALVLESRLIKQDKPRYNIRLRDGAGSYPYLHLSTDKAVPQLTVARTKRGKRGRYFGPFPSKQSVYLAHDMLQKHFGLRTCSDAFFAHRSRPCLEYQIGRCTAPCVGKITPGDYGVRVRELEGFLDGKGEGIIQEILQQMEEAAGALDFEKAAILRDRISSLRHVQSRVSVEQGENSFDAVAIAQGQRVACVSIVRVRDGQVVGVSGFCLNAPWDVADGELLGQTLAQHYLDEATPMPALLLLCMAVPDQEVLEQALAGRGLKSMRVGARGEDKPHMDLAIGNARAALDAALMGKRVQEGRWADFVAMVGLDTARVDGHSVRVECFDISHTMGQDTVASCVVFGPDGPRKALYRRYNISGITPGDDFAAMRQAVERRLASKTAPAPDVLLIDGGASQVTQAVDVARGLGLGFPIVGVSKGPERIGGEEDIVLDDGARVIHPGRDSQALLFIRSVRDEAHRFAVEGHRKRREKTGVASVLETIPGVGPKRRQALLKAFGGIQGLRQAGVDAIAAVPGIGRELAEQVAVALR